jgi:23S rRNA pseudouridine1911/1915/1917 synthase
VKAGAVVRVGNVVLIDRVELLDPETPQLGEVLVLTQTDDFLVLEKPPGMLVHRTAHEATRTVEAYLSRAFHDERVDPLHRLDRDTSGVLICGRGIDNIRAAKGVFENGDPEKSYLALAADPMGFWKVGDRKTCDTPLGFDPESSVRLRMGKGELLCASHFECLASENGRALLTVRIERGRQHQIRAHLHILSTPIVGDKLYQMGDQFFESWLRTPGDPALVAELPSRWHCLHAWKLSLPWNGTTLRYESAPPAWAQLPPG